MKPGGGQCPTVPSLSGRIYTSRYENNAGIDSTHRELHFLPSPASQFSKLSSGGLLKVGRISGNWILQAQISDFFTMYQLTLIFKPWTQQILCV